MDSSNSVIWAFLSAEGSEGAPLTVRATVGQPAGTVTWKVEGLQPWMTGSCDANYTRCSSYVVTGASPDLSETAFYPLVFTGTDGTYSYRGTAAMRVTAGTIVWSNFKQSYPSSATFDIFGRSTMTTGTYTAGGDPGFPQRSYSSPGVISGTMPGNATSAPITRAITGTRTSGTAVSTGTLMVTIMPSAYQIGGLQARYDVDEDQFVDIAPTVDYAVGAVTWSGTNLPPGLGLNATTGRITGRIARNAALRSPFNATLSARGTNTGSASVQFAVRATPLLSVSAESANLRQVLPDPGACTALTVTNHGSGIASALSLSVGDAAFATCAPPAGTPCGASLGGGGQSCVYGMRLNASVAGEKSTTATVTAAGTPPVTVAMAGVTAPAVATAGFRVFSTAGTFTFTPPRPNLPVRVLVVGSGAGGSVYVSSNYSQGGGSGYYRYYTTTVTGDVSVVVGAGSINEQSSAAGASSFGSLSAGGGSRMDGGSGGGGNNSTGAASATNYTYIMGNGGSRGGNGMGAISGASRAGLGQAYVPDLSGFRLNALTYGRGGSYGMARGSTTAQPYNYWPAGGGGGGILLNGSGGDATNGTTGVSCAASGEAGIGWGAGGGGTGESCGGANALPGKGSTGLVYVEWD